ncbi:MAG: hypothetical protein WAK93_11110 [Solirubrobacteraceae bacterium]
MNRFVLIFTIVASVAAIAVPAAASAATLAGYSETQALIHATRGQRSYPVRCAVAVNSTVTRGWAGWSFNQYARGCGRYGFNGVSYLQAYGGRWHLIYQGSDGYGRVPHRVANDIMQSLFG